MLAEPLLRVLNEISYNTPTPIQEKTIPVLLQKRDVLGCAQTGTGKTAAYSLPLLHLLNEKHVPNKKPAVRALILTPTRELAIQVSDSIALYTRYLPLQHLALYGGVPKFNQIRKLRQGVDVLIATPGRLLDMMQEKHVSLNQVEFFVLDEADHMLDLGFIHDVRRVISKLPSKRQTILLSATMPANVKQLAAGLLNNPEKIEIAKVEPKEELIEQALYYVDKPNKRHLLLHILKTEAIDTAIVFSRTKHGADKIAKFINNSGIKAEAIHGNKSQNSRQSTLENFINKTTRILVATDIAARGIDIKGVSHVINFDLPESAETYVHRIGRTGRAGVKGIAISFCEDEERSYLRDIQKLIAKTIPIVKNHPYDVPYKYGNETTEKKEVASFTPFRNGGSRRKRTFTQASF